MKFLIIGDLHGNKPKLHYTDFDAIIAPGDFCSDAPRKYMFEAMRWNFANPDEPKKWWYDIVGREEAQKMIKQSLADGRKILEDLNAIGKPVYVVPGNWDWTPKEDADWEFVKQDHSVQLFYGLENVVNCHHALVDAGDYQIVGHGIISGPEYPQYEQDVDRLKSEGKLEEKWEKYSSDKLLVGDLVKKAKQPVIFVPHNVPFNTELDKIDNKESPRDGHHFGSLIAREIVDELQPLVCIGGHMHEYHKKQMLGETTCINAGFGSEVNTLLEVDGNKVVNVEFYKG